MKHNINNSNKVLRGLQLNTLTLVLGFLFSVNSLASIPSQSLTETQDSKSTVVSVKNKSKGDRFKYSLNSDADAKLLAPAVTYGGIFYKAAKVAKPLNLISPFASESYGYGRGMVSWDPTQGKPKGFIAYSVKFW